MGEKRVEKRRAPARDKCSWLGSARAHDHSCRPPAPEVVGLKRHSGERSITFSSAKAGTEGRHDLIIPKTVDFPPACTSWGIRNAQN